MFLDPVVKMFEHPSCIVDCYDGSIRINFLNFNGGGTATTAVIKELRGRIRRHSLGRLHGSGSQHLILIKPSSTPRLNLTGSKAQLCEIKVSRSLCSNCKTRSKIRWCTYPFYKLRDDWMNGTFNRIVIFCRTRPVVWVVFVKRFCLGRHDKSFGVENNGIFLRKANFCRRSGWLSETWEEAFLL